MHRIEIWVKTSLLQNVFIHFLYVYRKIYFKNTKGIMNTFIHDCRFLLDTPTKNYRKLTENEVNHQHFICKIIN